MLDILSEGKDSSERTDSSLLECTIRELEKDCDTLENEANRLLMINKDLRTSMQSGTETITEGNGLI